MRYCTRRVSLQMKGWWRSSWLEQGRNDGYTIPPLSVSVMWQTTFDAERVRRHDKSCSSYRKRWRQLCKQIARTEQVAEVICTVIELVAAPHRKLKCNYFSPQHWKRCLVHRNDDGTWEHCIMLQCPDRKAWKTHRWKIFLVIWQ